MPLTQEEGFRRVLKKATSPQRHSEAKAANKRASSVRSRIFIDTASQSEISSYVGATCLSTCSDRPNAIGRSSGDSGKLLGSSLSINIPSLRTGVCASNLHN